MLITLFILLIGLSRKIERNREKGRRKHGCVIGSPKVLVPGVGTQNFYIRKKIRKKNSEEKMKKIFTKYQELDTKPPCSWKLTQTFTSWPSPIARTKVLIYHFLANFKPFFAKNPDFWTNFQMFSEIFNIFMKKSVQWPTSSPLILATVEKVRES